MVKLMIHGDMVLKFVKIDKDTSLQCKFILNFSY